MNLEQTGLYANKAFLTLEDVHRLTQSVVFLADCVYVPASVGAERTLPEAPTAFIYSRLRELHEIGAVKFWEVEGQTRFLTSSFSGPRRAFPIDRTIPSNEYKNIYQEVIERLNASREDFLGREAAGSFDGITEIVLGKHTLLTFALNSYLKTRTIVLDPVTEANSSRFLRRLLHKMQIADEVVQEVSVNLHIPDLSLLTVSQIQECRELMPAFRDKLFADIDASDIALQADRSDAIGQIADVIVDRFLEYLQKQANRPGLVGDFKSAAWSLAQMVFSRFITDENRDRFFRWGSSEVASAPELFLLRLRNLKKEVSQ